MNPDENRKRIQELRWIGFQKLLTGVVLVFAAGVLCFIFFGEDADSHSPSGGSYVRGRGLAFLLLVPAYGLWSIVRGVICLIRAQSGDENYAKGIEDTMDKYERKMDERMGQTMVGGSWHNVFILLGWVFLCLAVVGGIVVGYLFWTRPR
ncbi:MAG: hypothetical protein ACLPYZ_10800 [Limisphaerales bacterium]